MELHLNKNLPWCARCCTPCSHDFLIRFDWIQVPLELDGDEIPSHRPLEKAERRKA
jgi:hypothetical protein